jgi:1,4-dihydroxy-6-naphthoate synthase
VTKLSFSTWLRVRDEYALLRSGAALGFGCGPLLIAKQPLTEQDILTGPVAIPGELTTANMLFTMRYPGAQRKIPMLFSEIEQAVLDGTVKAGVIIHESRFTYEKKGLIRIIDLGEYWEKETALPIPLGAFAIRRSLGQECFAQVQQIIHDSIAYAFENHENVMPYVRQYAWEMEEEVMLAHIRTYVNGFSLELGTEGDRAVEMLKKKAEGN